MTKIKYAIIGNGFRAQAFLRIGLTLTDQFEVTSVLFRNKEKAAEFTKQSSVPASLTIEDCLATNPDFVVIAIGRNANFEMIKRLVPYGIPMLVETPPAMNRKDLLSLWDICAKQEVKIQIAEQYFLHPLYQAKLKVLEKGILGEVHNLSISWAHDYHGVSLLRKLLGVGFENAQICGKNFQFPVTVTDSRYGIMTDGEVTMADRARYTIEFESGKVAFYDFSSDVQYRSKIRARHLTIQGVRGEMDDETVRCLTDDNQPLVQTFQITQDINTLSTYSINLGGECYDTNPFASKRLTDDEISISRCLMGMKDYLLTGKSFYSLADGCQDNYFFLLMQEALLQPNIPVGSKTQPWSV
ncbi:Gfo/Idh/MocA family oxidoreductase [Clostridium sp. E02]|uniref:Gfo/Idh/MocA family protein n=1 Tax=Clostridium sp. E02 TaxID=2487134 RepID=UPI000F51D4AE|nr:Gfo/Idh/MocA family oxidoreductase [Clostridium sp. E02]